MNKAIFKENLRRFWPISIAAFLAYFLSGPFIFFQQGMSSSYGSLIDAISTSNVGYMFTTCIMTVTVASSVYGYLFKVNSSVFMHTIPVSRRNLLLSSGVSGLVLTFAPVLANGLVLMGICLANPQLDKGYGLVAGGNWSVWSILGWMAAICVEIFFIFAICTLSAVISGNSVINTLTSCALNLLTTALYLSAMAYADGFLWGYVENDGAEELLLKLHPVLGYGACRLVFGEGDGASLILSMAIYVAAALLILVLAYWLYTKRPNEKAGDSYVFDVVSTIISVLMVYLGASCIGLIFQSAAGYWGFVIGGVFSFLVGQLIVQKSFRIFNRNLLAPLLASFVVMGLVLAAFAADLLHVERRVPNADDVACVKLYDSEVYGSYYDLSDPSNIQSVIDFHSSVLDSKKAIQDAEKQADENCDYSEWNWFNITYCLKSGKTIERSYNLPETLADSFGSLEKIYHSSEVLRILDSLKTSAEETTLVSVYLEDYEWREFINPYGEKYSKAFDRMYTEYYGMNDLTAEEKTQLLSAIASDIERIGLRSIDEYQGISYFYVDVEIIHPLGEWDEFVDSELEYGSNFHNYWYVTDDNGAKTGVEEKYSLEIMSDYTETLKVLDEILAERFE